MSCSNPAVWFLLSPSLELEHPDCCLSLPSDARQDAFDAVLLTNCFGNVAKLNLYLGVPTAVKIHRDAGTTRILRIELVGP